MGLYQLAQFYWSIIGSAFVNKVGNKFDKRTISNRFILIHIQLAVIVAKFGRIVLPLDAITDECNGIIVLP